MLKLTVNITKVAWVNPHVNVSFNVKGLIGAVQAWSFRLDAPSKLQTMGLDRTVFKIGDEVTVILKRGQSLHTKIRNWRLRWCRLDVRENLFPIRLASFLLRLHSLKASQ